MSPSSRLPLWLSSLALAWIFDQLFWEKQPGVSFLIFVLLCLAVGLWHTWRETEGFKIARPPVGSLVLLAPVLFFAAMTFLRAEPLTLFIGYFLTLAGLAVLSATWLGGRWQQYSLSDYVVNFFRWLGGILTLPSRKSAAAQEGGEGPASGADSRATRRAALRSLRSVGVGLLLAIPVLFILAGLLAQADPIFEKQLSRLFDWLSFENLAEYIFRGTYILIGAYLLAGVYLYALFSSPGEKVSDVGKPWLPPFLGWIEASTLLACVNLLFTFFVAVQFRYFFGGQANIAVEGYTYSEYARRGFGELVAVAVISLLLFLGASFITKREAARPRKVFSALGILLVALVGVMLVSAFQRLALYEAAYGFTRLRTYTHIFMIWLGLLLLATVILEAFGCLRRFALAMVVAVLGFSASLPLINVDGLIVRQNVPRAVAGEKLDSAYLVSLSNDAVPALFERFHDLALPQEIRDDLGGVLACKKGIAEADTRKQPWPSFSWPRYQAQGLFARYGAELDAYALRQDDYNGWEVQVGGEWRACTATWFMD